MQRLRASGINSRHVVDVMILESLVRSVHQIWGSKEVRQKVRRDMRLLVK